MAAAAFYPEKSVTQMLGLSRTTLWRLTKNKEFPSPVSLSPRRVGYPAALVDQWIAKKTGGGSPAPEEAANAKAS